MHQNLDVSRHIPARLLLAGTILLLAGCDSTKLSRTFGLTRDAPDEFMVTTRAPLSMPPDFNLRPPRPGASRPQEQSERDQAEAALVPQVALGSAPAGRSPGQAALLNEVGPAAPGNIRDRVDQDAKLARADESFIDSVLYWRKPDPNQAVVDPEREARRIRTNAALGQSQDDTRTPVIQERRKGWFNNLFSWF